MTEQPLVSIIMNCHNSENFLDQAINSVYSQTYNNWEIIFWDNASNDQTSTLIRKFDHKLKYFRSKYKTNLGEARIKAVNKAKGKYLTFLDGDDLWLPKKLENQVNLFNKNKEAGIIYSRANIINRNNKIIGIMPERDDLPEGNIFAELIKENFIPFVSAMVCKEKYYSCGGFPKNLMNATDYSLFLNIAFSHKILPISEITCLYRHHEQNLSSLTKIIGDKESIEIVKKFLPNPEAVIGLKYQTTNLICSYIKEFRLLKASLMIVNNLHLFLLVSKKILNSFLKKFN